MFCFFSPQTQSCLPPSCSRWYGCCFLGLLMSSEGFLIIHWGISFISFLCYMSWPQDPTLSSGITPSICWLSCSSNLPRKGAHFLALVSLNRFLLFYSQFGEVSRRKERLICLFNLFFSTKKKQTSDFFAIFHSTLVSIIISVWTRIP